MHWCSLHQRWADPACATSLSLCCRKTFHNIFCIACFSQFTRMPLCTLLIVICYKQIFQCHPSQLCAVDVDSGLIECMPLSDYYTGTSGSFQETAPRKTRVCKSLCIWWLQMSFSPRWCKLTALPQFWHAHVTVTQRHAFNKLHSPLSTSTKHSCKPLTVAGRWSKTQLSNCDCPRDVTHLGALHLA